MARSQAVKLALAAAMLLGLLALWAVAPARGATAPDGRAMGSPPPSPTATQNHGGGPGPIA